MTVPSKRPPSARPKPKREWSSLSAAGIEVRWDRDHPFFHRGLATIKRMFDGGWIK